MRFATASDPTRQRPAVDPSELSRQYLEVRRTTERLCEPLSAEDQMVQSMADASPAKWHQAHTSWFFETFILVPNLHGYRSLDSRYTFFFNSYYKQLNSKAPSSASSSGASHPVRAQRGLWSRPSLEEVRTYRHHVDEHMTRLLEQELPDEVAALVILGINHEQQHQELILTDIKHALWTNPLRPAYREHRRDVFTDIPQSRWLDYDGGQRMVGHEGDEFSFDNETPRHPVLLSPFRIGSRLITNAEYMAFMADEGYTRPELWLSEGWDAVCANGWNAPLYWEEHNGEWCNFTLNGEQGVNPSEPVCHVSFFEADAYARWAGARLSTEFEWEVAAAELPVRGNLLDSDQLHPVGARALSCDEIPDQMFGDVWEWTASPYVAYPGFRPAAGVLGEYNGKFMCNQMVLRGGSCATPASHTRATYRNFFPPQARWQFSGIRLAHD